MSRDGGTRGGRAALLVAAALLAGGAAVAAPLPPGDLGVQPQPVAAYGATRPEAVRLPAGRSFAVPVMIPRGGRLVSAVAVPDRIWNRSLVESAAPVRARVRLTIGERELVLYERRIDITRPRDRRWFDFGRNLSAHAGRRGTLHFETTVPEGAAPLPVLWAWPRLADCGDPGPSVVLIAIDALRADHLGLYRYARPTSPHLDAFAAGATTFRRAFVGAPKTIPSIPQLLTGAYFFAHRATAGLAALLGPADGPPARAIVNNPYVTKWLRRSRPGFDTVIAGELDARAITSEALRFLSAVGQCRSVLYLHYLDPHTPYGSPPRYARRFIDPSRPTRIGLTFDDVSGAWQDRYGAADRQRIVDLYDGAIAWTDRQLGRLFRGLSRRGRLARSLVVVTADHGEEFWDHGRFFHGQSLYDELLRVPLIVRFPDVGHGRALDRVVSTVDVVPTIAEVTGRPAPPGDGESLRPLAAGAAAPTDERAVFATVSYAEPRTPPRHAVRTATHKLIHNIADGSFELYDLAADPAERAPLAADSPPGPRLRTALDAFRAGAGERGYQLRVTSRADRPVRYVVRLRTRPPVPIVDIERLTLEPEDRLRVGRRGLSFTARGTLEPGDVDRLRFDVLADAGSLRVGVRLDDAPAPAGVVRLGTDRAPGGPRVALDDPALLGAPPADAAPPEPTAPDGPPAAVTLWRAGTRGAAGAPPPLDPAARDRLRALGYLE